MNFTIIGCYIVVLQLMLTNCSADRRQDEGGESAVEGTAQCQNLEIMMVHNSSTGMDIVLTSTLSNTTLSEHERDADLHLPNRYLPPECGTNNYRCSILHIEKSETSYYIIPSIGGFIILSHSANYSNQVKLQTSFITIEKCNPTKAFYTGNYVVVACMDLPTGSRGKIFYLRYDFSAPNGDTARDTTLTYTRSQSEPIYNTETVSEAILITGQKRCQSTSNLYFIDDAYVVHSRSKLSPREFIPSTDELQDCVGYLENYGEDIIVIRCTNSKTVLYDTCSDGSFNYQPLDRIPYPCSSWNTISYRNGSQLALVNDRGGEVYATQELPFDDISFGRCIQGADQSIFIVSSADGSIFITRFDGNNVTKIASGNCSNNGGMSCPRPVFSENEHVFGTFDSETDSFVIVNVTEECIDSPVIAQIPVAFVPDLVSVTLGQETYSCSCPLSTTQTESTPETTRTEPATVQTDDDTKSTTATNPSESTSSPTESSTSAFHQQPHSTASSVSNNGGLLAAVILPSLAVIAMIILTLVSLVCKYSQLRDIKAKGDLPPESDGTGSTLTSDESMEMVSFYAESGQLGGGIYSLSKDALPFKPTQLGAGQVCENIHSRIADNRDREDMDTKVQACIAEDNNRES